MVSIILPNFNHARFLRQRIDSILGQTYKDFELIILDDCSTDDSREIIREYISKNNRIRYEFNEVNSGNPFRQWQKGIKMANGEFIWIAESDDFAELTMLEQLMEKLAENVSADIAYCQSHFVDQDNKIIGNHLKNLSMLDSELWKHDFCLPGKELLSKYMIIINVIPNASAVVFKKSLAEKVDWREIQSFKLSGDRLFWSILLNQTNLCFVADSLNYFRMGDSTVRSKHDTTPDYLFERLRVLLSLNEMVIISPGDKIKCIRNFKEHLNKIRKKNGKNLGFRVNWKISSNIFRFDRKNFIRNLRFIFFDRKM
jgi:glycosyltransferase involved in cell wall biosynthesis